MTSAAWAAATVAIGTVIPERPWPEGINRGQVGNWDFIVNASNEPQAAAGHEKPIEPFGIILMHRDYVLICALAPSGGVVAGGMSEDEFIAEMEALANPQEPTP